MQLEEDADTLVSAMDFSLREVSNQPAIVAAASSYEFTAEESAKKQQLELGAQVNQLMKTQLSSKFSIENAQRMENFPEKRCFCIEKWPFRSTGGSADEEARGPGRKDRSAGGQGGGG